eukprot:1182794-Prorocentrum_minimum.AAC.1
MSQHGSSEGGRVVSGAPARGAGAALLPAEQVFLLAGEPSGDLLAARLMEALRAAAPLGVDFQVPPRRAATCLASPPPVSRLASRLSALAPAGWGFDADGAGCTAEGKGSDGAEGRPSTAAAHEGLARPLSQSAEIRARSASALVFGEGTLEPTSRLGESDSTARLFARRRMLSSEPRPEGRAGPSSRLRFIKRFVAGEFDPPADFARAACPPRCPWRLR